MQSALDLLSWSATGYYPTSPPTWLPPHKRLEVSSDDLAGILELDDTDSDAAHASLWEAATGVSVQARVRILARMGASVRQAAEPSTSRDDVGFRIARSL